MSNLYTTMTWRELKIVQVCARILRQHNYYIAAGELRTVTLSQSLPMHREARGPGGMLRGRPVRTVELPLAIEARAASKL